MIIGFSTGSLAFGDFKLGIDLLAKREIKAIELSSLREAELQPFLESIDDLSLDAFDYISVHVPSKLESLSESQLVDLLLPIVEKGWYLIVHPNVISDSSRWQQFGELLCIENMDKRKPIGRTVRDLESIFQKLPDASFCLDLAHARQVDPTMSEAFLMLKRFGSRLKQLHLSEVNSQSRHEGLSFEAILAYCRIAEWVNPFTPVILESPVPEDKIEEEICLAELIFDEKKRSALLDQYQNLSGYFSQKFDLP